ncbi:hypothetical protein EPIB1_1474 [Tritonibacter mobilis]|nr:hypothetical protein EPIB1_1474 [Tritonibacter mobilis]
MGRLPGGLGSGHSAADDMKLLCHDRAHRTGGLRAQYRLVVIGAGRWK